MRLTLGTDGRSLFMKDLGRMIVRAILGLILLGVVLSGLVLVSLAAMYSDRHSSVG